MYSPAFPRLDRSTTKALENGKAIISPMVINNIPTIKMPIQGVINNTTKLNAVKSSPIIIKNDFF